MRKLLLTTALAACVTFAPAPAEAGVILGALSAVAGWWGSLSALTQAAIQLGAGLLLSQALNKPVKPEQADIKRDLSQPTSTPAKRFVYGHTEVTGTPLFWRVDRWTLYGAILFNSRPSAGTNLSITLDDRTAEFVSRATGNPVVNPTPGDSSDLFDWTSDGQHIKAEKFNWGPNNDLCVAWLSLGDETSPPDRFLTEIPQYVQATDGWQGCTVLWVRCNAGSESHRHTRWPSVPPQFKLTMDWSYVWDPTDVTQDKDDPDTWTYSANQARCLLDAARQNPVRVYDDDYLDLDGFIDGVTLADEQVLKYYETQDAGSDVYEDRYRVGGVVDWTKGELLDLLEPLAQAGGGELCITQGQLSYVPGAYQAPVYTMDSVLTDADIDLQRYGSRREVPYALVGTWTSEERYFEKAALAPYLVPNGSPNTDDIEAFDLPLVPSGTQAQRLTAMEAKRRGLQKTLSCVLPPSAIKLKPGSTVTGNCPSPFTRLNGEWRAARVNPSVWLQDDENGKVALRVEVELNEYGSTIYDWDPATDEQEILTADLSAEGVALGTVTNLTATTVEVDTGGAFVTMIEFGFDHITDYVVDSYDVEWKEAADSDYVNRLILYPENVNGSGRMVGSFGPVVFDDPYDMRVAANGPTSAGLYSYALGIVAGLEVSGTSAVAGSGTGTVTVDFTSPDSDYFEGVRLYRAATGQPFSSATQVGDDMPCAKNTAHSIEFGDPAPGNLYSDGGFDASGSHTMTGAWVVASSQAQHPNPGLEGTITQTIAELTAGDTYRFSTTVAATDGASTGHVQLIGSTTVSGDNLGSTGMTRQDLVAPAGVTDAGIYAATDKALSVDLLVIHKVDSDDIPLGTADFWIVPYSTTGTNGTATSLGSLTVT
ncbi:phage tail protein [Marinovum algicola]|uniref:phage tail protein n=1 Tax=Marinovum algicola TaxID=42444 RepID=UPI0024BB75FE|nr:phage tail protein [Marinovum algicola]